MVHRQLIKIALLFFISVFYGCEPKSPLQPSDCPPYEEECEIIPPPDWIEYNEIGDSLNIFYPCVNPENSDEVIFLRNENGWKLYKYNINSGTNSIIYSGVLLSPPRWGSDDWIMIAPSDTKLWKIKSDGSELTQLTDLGCFHGDWNFNGEKITYANMNIQKNIIADADGNILDTLNYSLSGTQAWNHPNSLIGLPVVIPSGGLNIFNHLTNETTFIPTPDDISNYSGMQWNPQGTGIIWSGKNGIYLTKLSGNTFRMIESCDSKKWLFPSISGNSVYFEYRESTLINQSNSLYVKRRLWRMDHDGTCLEEINIPQFN